jgi:hypothetical protein
MLHITCLSGIWFIRFQAADQLRLLNWIQNTDYRLKNNNTWLCSDEEEDFWMRTLCQI